MTHAGYEVLGDTRSRGIAGARGLIGTEVHRQFVLQLQRGEASSQIIVQVRAHLLAYAQFGDQAVLLQRVEREPCDAVFLPLTTDVHHHERTQQQQRSDAAQEQCALDPLLRCDFRGDEIELDALVRQFRIGSANGGQGALRGA